MRCSFEIGAHSASIRERALIFLERGAHYIGAFSIPEFFTIFQKEIAHKSCCILKSASDSGKLKALPRPLVCGFLAYNVS